MVVRNAHYGSLLDVAQRLRAKEISPVELTEYMLKRISTKDKRLKSYATVTADLAMKQAKKAEKEILGGRSRGPLHGVPIAVKDLCYTKGINTAAGMTIHKGFRPKFDATVVKRFADAGAVLLGKLQMTEGAFADHHPDIAPPVNPWHRDYWPGASSSGSGVATAAGLCFASLGSDTGGSIRFPSAANGVTGLKPTWGRVSRHGVFDLAPTLDHVGPMCRTAADAGAVLGVIAGADGNDPTASSLPVPNYLAGLERGLNGLRIGIDPTYNRRGVDDTMMAAVKSALAVFRAMGADVREVTFPNTDGVVDEWTAHCGIETAYAHRDTYPKHKDRYGPALSGLIDLGHSLSATDYQEILLHRHDFCGNVRALFDDIDVLVIPAQSAASPTLQQMETLGEDPGQLSSLLRFTAPTDLTGSPALTMPAGFTKAGMPVAIQLVGRHFEEDILVRAGHAYQRETDWHLQHPAI
ncbi:MAG: amidase [Rhodospirillaceae bacterium]|jgi:amidase|nr:amidase [Rhodospirillaceae bacterium]MBT4490110.1 amidase [Rhodospirillaceae bacterium]MBT4690702.1 amidase [Rhodospirillaceae bacterium]MBT5079116.1 amidase [Rhodospirillaceae bacterium]MBT5522772.1 amidase [Rhodospirillaceae bacterium]